MSSLPHASPVALVTGAAGGLGLAIAAALGARGDHVHLADIDADAVEAAAESLRARGLNATALRLDVTDASMVATTIATIDARTPLGTVVNNAGVAFSLPLVDTPIHRFDRLMAVNVRGTFAVTQAAARAMIPRGSGSIVNICSTSSFSASTGPMAAYDASKGAVAMMTRATARELAPTGIRVNGVAPGTMDTTLMRDLAGTDLGALASDRIPLGRLGETSEVAAAVDYLSSPAASYVLGHVLVVDGGWLA